MNIYATLLVTDRQLPTSICPLMRASSGGTNDLCH